MDGALHLSQSRGLPIPLTPLIGRERERIAIVSMLEREDVRLLTLTGPGGVGKTRLALQVATDLADAFAGDVFFVPLATIRDPTLVIPTIAQALGLQDLGSRPLAERLIEVLRQRQTLLLLDNLEQVLDAAPHLAALLVACSHLKILATSRSILHLSGEHDVPVTPLALPPSGSSPSMADVAAAAAVRLFVARAGAARPEFVLTDQNAVAVAAVCQRLDGLPLAIELAATRITHLPPASLLARLDRRLPLLTGGPHDLPARLRTMRSAIAWSHDLLSPAEQALFRRLAVFAGGFTLEAAEAVGDAEGEDAMSILNAVASLVAQSLLHQVEEVGVEPRYTMLETIREYGLEQLAASSENEAVRQRYAAYYFLVAERAQPEHPEVWVSEPSIWLLEREHPNLRSVLTWLIERGETETCLRLVCFLGQFWYQHGHLSEGSRWIEHALARADEAPPDLRTEALWSAATLAHYQGDGERAVALIEAGLALAQERGGTWLTPYFPLMLGILAEDQGRYAAAVPFLEEAHTTSARLGYGSCQALALGHLAVVAYGQGNLSRATAFGEEALRFARSREDTQAAGLALWYLGLTACTQGDYPRAATCLTEMLAVDLVEGNRDAIAQGLSSIAVVAIGLGQADAAARLFGAAEALRAAVGAALVLPERATCEAAAAAARNALGDEAFATAWAAGQALALDESVAVAHAVAAAAAIPAPLDLAARSGRSTWPVAPGAGGPPADGRWQI